jgi:predicted enzyme related to lactoylglutathione lyase
MPGEGTGAMSPDWARPVVHWEIEARDPERQRQFYEAMFSCDINASLALARQLGATVLSEPFDVPGGPTIAPIIDLEGTPLVLVQQ